MVRCPSSSSVRSQFQTSSSTSSKKTLGQSKPNFYVEPPWEGGTKGDIKSPGLAKMAAMPIYGKNLKKSSSPEPVGL